MTSGRAWAQIASIAFQAGFGVLTGNPVPAVTGAVSFAGWLYDTWQAAADSPSASHRPTQSLAPVLAASVDRPWSASTTLGPQARSSWSPPAQAVDPTTEAIRRRAQQIADSPQAGSDYDNWLRAVVEVAIAERAAEIAGSQEAGSDFDNWLRAERELKIAQRAEEIARSPQAGAPLDNWLRAEREVRIAQRAQEIAQTRPAGGEQDNWWQAEREIDLERELIAARARDIAASRPGGELDHWLEAERELRAAGRIGQ